MAKEKRPLTQQDAFDLSPAVREAAWGLKGHLLRNGHADESGRPMTAPDDVRARFEAWASDGGKRPKAVERTGYDDGYRLMVTHLYWLAWQAAHADLAGEVRELVEVVQALERACDEALIVNTYYEDEVGALSAAAKSALDKLRHKERT